MKIYVITYTATPIDGCNGGYSFFSSQKTRSERAKEAKKNGYEVEFSEINIQPTKKDIIRALNVHASHADNG